MLKAYEDAIRSVVALVAERRYLEAIGMCRASRITAAELGEVVKRYGRTLVPLPDEAMLLVTATKIQNSHPPAWSVVVPFFTLEEGRSDLSLELTISESASESFAVELDDVRVL